MRAGAGRSTHVSEHPAGWRAILFCDVAGSTRLFSQLGDVAARALISGLLDELLRLVRQHDGTLIKTIGDELMCGFPTPDAAVEAAIGMQKLSQARRIVSRDVPLSIRVGIHWGPVIIEGGDYFGDAVNVAARIAGAATIERILVSAAVAEAVARPLAQSMRLRGRRAFKGIAHVVDIHEVLWRQGTMLVQVHARAEAEAFDFALSALTLVFGDQLFTLEAGGKDLKIGRSSDNTVVIPDAFVSSRHASIESWGGRFVLVDTSSNGTFIRPAGGQFTRISGDAPLTGRGELAFGRLDVQTGGQALVAHYTTV
jgi:class 3 adenylate cyclase